MARKGILGTKLGMTQVFDENNRVVPVTVVKAGPNVVTRIRTPERDGYSAVQLAYGEISPRKVNKPLTGQYTAAGVNPRRHLAELRLDDEAAAGEYEVGQELTAEIFADGAYVDVTGTSKGKGFAGTMKRHGFSGQGASHGAQAVHRRPGSIGGCATPGRVFKGTRMSGRMGNDRVTTQNLLVHKVDAENGVLLIKGAIPGRTGGLVDGPQRNQARRKVMAAKTLKIDVHTPDGKKDGSVELPAELFDVEPNIALMHQVVEAQRAAARQGTHSTKTRGEVRGGGKKPYRQKGTGRARQGSTRAPQFTGGGTVHGPKPRDYSQRTPKKMIAAALRGALSDRARNGRIHAVTELVEGQAPSTKSAKAFLATLTERKQVLVVIGRSDETGAQERAQPAWRARALAGPAQHLRRAEGRRRGVQRRGAGCLHQREHSR